MLTNNTPYNSRLDDTKRILLQGSLVTSTSYKATAFFFRGLILRGIARRGGEWREFPGSKIEIFPRHVTPGGEKLDFFLANPAPAGKILTFFSPWRGIGSFLCILARNLYFWRGICMFWRGNPRQTSPGGEKFS